jgi:short-subunit dehydrogenase
MEGSGIEVALVMPGAIRTGIVDNSPFYSEEQKAKLRSLSEGRSFALEPDRAADKILSAIEKGRHRIVLGAMPGCSTSSIASRRSRPVASCVERPASCRRSSRPERSRATAEIALASANLGFDRV